MLAQDGYQTPILNLLLFKAISTKNHFAFMFSTIKSFLRSTAIKVLISKIRSRTLKLSDITCYLVAEWRYHVWLRNPKLIRKRIRQQIELRFMLADAECLSDGHCKHCGCDMPQLMFCNKPCEGNCYPPIV